MKGNIYKVHCNKCGKDLFTEADGENGIKRSDDNEDYYYDEIQDIFLCKICYRNQ